MLEQGDLTSVPVEWHKPEYWDSQALDTELRRQYDVCNSCRLCFNLCPGFPTLFVHFDSEEVEADPDKLTGEQVGEFVDLCYNCKLCFIKCPYTPPHKFLMDIPRLVMRARAVMVREDGVDLRERILSSPVEVGRLSSLLAPVVNWANGNKLNRRLLERFLGVHRSKILPKFHTQTFVRWFKKNVSRSTFRSVALSSVSGVPKVAIFHTCVVNYNEPRIGRALVRVLEKNRAEIVDPKGQDCCGMPALDSGRIEDAIEHFRANVELLLPYVREGFDIVVPEPTCGMMLKKEYADYLQGDEHERAIEVSKRVYDLSEYLVKLNSEGRLNRDFPVPVGTVAYHRPCHLKYQAIGHKSVELLRIAGAEVILIDRGCSGHDGTWAMKKEYFDLAQKVAGGLHRGVNDSGAETIATDCSLAGLQITQGTSKRTVHPVEVLARAYGLDVES